MLSVIVFYGWLTTLALLAAQALTTRNRGIRWASCICVTSSLLGIAAAHLFKHWGGPHPALFALDILATFAMAAVAMIERRMWSATATGVQGAHVALHVIYFLNRGHNSAAYYTGFAILGFCLAATIFIGAFGQSRYDWRTARRLHGDHKVG